MERNDKLERVVAAIQQTRISSPVGRRTVNINDRNGLLDIAPKELREMLQKLQNRDKVIKLENFPDAACVLASITALKGCAWEKLTKNERHFTVTILDSFDQWYAGFWVETALESELGSVIEQIGRDAKGFVETLQQVGRTEATLELLRRLGMSGEPSLGTLIGEDFNRPNRKRAALSNQEVNADRAPIPIHLTITPSRPILKVDSSRGWGGASMRHEEQDLPGDEIVYSITFTKAREIFLNDTVHNIVHLLAKPSFDSENDNVFTYLYEHPNQKFTKKQIEDGVHIAGIKNLHKIVENLGFQGDIKRAFFNVSEQSVQFRNSITREDLKNLHIDEIKPPK